MKRLALWIGGLLAGQTALAGELPPDWVPGDIHVHATGASWDGDDKSFPEAIKQVALERGLKFIVLTDHSDATGSKDASPPYYNLGPEFTYWDKAAALSEPDKFLMIDGNEISPLPAANSKPAGHIGCVPADLKTFNRNKPFTDRPPGAVTGGKALAQCKALGGFTIVNHAYSPAPWTEYDWTSRDYDAFEVFNGGMFFDRYDKRVIDAGLCDWALGKKTVFVGGSDTHRVFIVPGKVMTESALGLPTTYVQSKSLTWPDLMAAIKANRVVTGTPSTFFAATLSAGGKILGGIGDTVQGAGKTLDLKAEGFAPPGMTMELAATFVPTGGCEDLREAGANKSPKLQKQPLASFIMKTGPDGKISFNEKLTFPGKGVLHLLLQKKPVSSMEIHVAIANPIGIQ